VNVQDCIFFQLASATRTSLRFLSRRMSALDLTVPQAIVLICLRDGDELTSRQIGELVHLDSATLTGVLDRLEAMAAIERRPNPEDRRSILVFLTDKGTELAKSANRVAEQANQEVLAVLSRAEDRDLRRLLRELSETASRAAAD
jgi:DNA-binding MarR family transcriptional regulator